MKHKCLYCGRMRKSLDEPCPGCGQTEIAEVSERRENEFFHKGYFVKSVSNGLVAQTMEYYFFRGRDLIDRIEINWRDMMYLREADGLSDGESDFHLIWEMFEASQMEKFGVVKTYETDPRIKRIEVRLVPWGVEYCQAVLKNGERHNYRAVNGSHLCRHHGGKSHANWAGVAYHPKGSLQKLIRRSVGLDE